MYCARFWISISSPLNDKTIFCSTFCFLLLLSRRTLFAFTSSVTKFPSLIYSDWQESDTGIAFFWSKTSGETLERLARLGLKFLHFRTRMGVPLSIPVSDILSCRLVLYLKHSYYLIRREKKKSGMLWSIKFHRSVSHRHHTVMRHGIDEWLIQCTNSIIALELNLHTHGSCNRRWRQVHLCLLI